LLGADWTWDSLMTRAVLSGEVALVVPTGSAGRVGCSAVLVVTRWQEVEGEKGYRVYRDGALIATLGAGAASYDDTSPDLKTYGYQVEAYNGYGSGVSSARDSESCVY
jgi:hypothetical protein